MVPINVPAGDIETLATQFGCQIGRMPFTYLGLPLGSTRPAISDLMPLVCRLRRKLTSREIIAITIGKGDTFLFCEDSGILNGSNNPMKKRFPQLFSYALNS
jgi:hypothetical protein